MNLIESVSEGSPSYSFDNCSSNHTNGCGKPNYHLRTKVLHGPSFVVVFDVLCGKCGGGFITLRQKYLSKHCLLRFLCLNIKICFIVCAVKRFRDCNTKWDHAELFSLGIILTI